MLTAAVAAGPLDVPWWAVALAGVVIASQIGRRPAETPTPPEEHEARDDPTPPCDGPAESRHDDVPTGLLIVDPSDRLESANAVARGDFRVTAADIGRPLIEVLRSPALTAAIQGAAAGDVGERALEFSGREFRAVARRRPDGRTVVLLIDESESRARERSQREFVTNISHELKTPLTSIQAFAETLSAGVDDEAVRDRFHGRILEQSARLRELIDDLLSLGREEAARERAGGRIDLSVPTRAAVDAVSAVAETHGVRVEANLPAVHAVAEAEACRRIADNLLRNAVLYTPDGGRVTVSTQRQDRWATLTVADTGVGIPADALPHIFDRFYRVDRARDRATGGSGIGLAIVRASVERMGGRVDVESEVGRGSVFRVRLPLAE